MRTIILLPVLLLVLAACQQGTGPEIPEVQAFRINPERITVSGLSSGAYMAGQMHVAHSDLVHGAGIISGGPYWCAQESLTTAIGPCVKGGDIDLQAIQQYIDNAWQVESIDQPENLTDDPVWIFHGTLDEAVNKSVTAAGREFYANWLPDDQIQYVDNINVVHGMPTTDVGLPCDEFGEPYLNACDYDAAGLLLKHLYGPLQPKTQASNPLQKIDQSEFADAEMWEHAFLYAPESCRNGESCGLHVVFHGCMQSAEYLGDAFARGAGYNEWAESNDLLILYPQVASSKMMPLNPKGCWDWWGYTDEHYATKEGAQIAAVKSIMDRLSGDTF